MKNILKKVSCFTIAVISVFCITACDSGGSVSTTKNPFGGMQSMVCTVEVPGYHNGIKYEEVQYLTFEEMCEKVDYIVVANSIDIVYYYDEAYVKYSFNIKESILGDLTGEIDVCVKAEEEKNYMVDVNGRKRCFWETPMEIPEKTDDVVLFLTLEENLEGFDAPVYTWRGAPSINLDRLDLSEMYNEPIAKHMTGLDFNNAAREEVLAYIESLTAKRIEID